ncbi:MAG: hypothetical protein K6F51_08480 [Acetatifactor sp.]|nr:hypothetical protein [Acetatifactor sp.]
MKKKRRKMQWITRICGGMLAAWFVMALCTPVFLHAAGSNAGKKITVDDAGHSEGFAAIL